MILPGEERLWQSVLAGKTPEEIQRGFRDYFAQPTHDGVFMPKPGEILALIEECAEISSRERRWDETDREMKANREARKSGKAVSRDEVLKTLQRVVEDAAKKLAAAKRMPVDPALKEVIITPEMRERARQQTEVVMRLYGKEKKA